MGGKRDAGEDSCASISDSSDTSDTDVSRERMRDSWLEFVRLTQEHTSHYYAKYKLTKHRLGKVSKDNDELEKEVNRLRSELADSQGTLNELQEYFVSFANKFTKMK